MYRKLRGRIIEKYGTFRVFAKVLGHTPETVSNYMRGRSKFTVPVMDKWAALLDIKRSEYPEYFFA